MINVYPLRKLTTSHLSEGEIQAYLDGEIEPASIPRYARHLRRCVQCRLTMAIVLVRVNQVAGLLDAWRL